MIQRLMYRLIHTVFMAPADAGGGGGGGPAGGAPAGGGPAAPNPQEARTYLSERWHDPASLTTMPDADLMALHSRVRPVWDKVEQTAAEKAQANWRQAIAGDNKDHLKTLERFASPKNLYDSYDSLRTRVSNGELKAVTPFPAQASPEEQNAWRAANGVPPDPKGYEIKLPAGVEIHEADKPHVEGFTKFAHENHLPGNTVNQVLGWWAQSRAQSQQAATENFKQQELETAATLGREWGADYKPHMNRIEGLLTQTLPNDEEGKALQTQILSTIKTNPAFARHYAQLALEMNPAGALVGGDHGATEGSVTDELKKIDQMMRTNRRGYDNDAKAQERYRTLLDGYQRLTGKAWNPTATA